MASNADTRYLRMKYKAMGQAEQTQIPLTNLRKQGG